MNPLTLAKVGSFLQKNWVYFAIAGVLALALLLAFCAGGLGQKNKQLQQTIETQKEVGKADTKAADTRVNDTVVIEQQKQELRNAIDNATGSDDARRRSGCVILRQQGRPLPASCR